MKHSIPEFPVTMLRTIFYVSGFSPPKSDANVTNVEPVLDVDMSSVDISPEDASANDTSTADHHADEKVVPEEQKRESYGEKNVLCSLSSRCLWPEVAFLNVSLNFDATIDKKFPRVCRTTLLSRKDISFVAGTIFFCLLHVKIVTFSFLTLV